MLSPDPLSPTPNSPLEDSWSTLSWSFSIRDSNWRDSRKHARGPWCPWTSNWRQYPNGIFVLISCTVKIQEQKQKNYWQELYLSSPVGARLKEFNCNTSHVNCIFVNGNQNTLFSPILSFLYNKSQQDFNHIPHQLLQLNVHYIPNPTIISHSHSSAAHQ
jgi:hypothetical protein